jgi:hypothetical protein
MILLAFAALYSTAAFRGLSSDSLAGDEPPWIPRVLHIKESKPVTSGNARFVAVSQVEWKVPKRVGARIAIETQLRITNLSKDDTTFPTFDSFGINLKKPDGAPIKPRSGRDITAFTSPIRLAPEASYSISREAQVRWNAETKSATLTYYDGTGSVFEFQSLRPGSYKLGFWYSTTDGNSKNIPKDNDAGAAWSGNVVTDEVLVEISAP